jgi:hypothetical protein
MFMKAALFLGLILDLQQPPQKIKDSIQKFQALKRKPAL